MNLSINNSINNQPNFQARIKIGKPSLKAITQSAIGTSAFAAGSVAAGTGVLSVDALGDTGSITHALPIDKELADGIHKGLQEALYSADTRYDAAVEMKGIPVQSTIAPSGFAGSATMSSIGGSNAFTNAIGKDNLLATTRMPINTSEALSANKLFQKSAFGTAYLGLAAASIYSGLHPEFEDMLPQSVQGMSGSPEDYADDNGYVDPYYYDSQSYKGDYAGSLMSTGLSAIGLPTSSLCSKGLEKSSDTKSGQFVKETLTENKSNTNIPS